LERQWRKKTLEVSAEITAILARTFSAAQRIKHDAQAESELAAGLIQLYCPLILTKNWAQNETVP